MFFFSVFIMCSHLILPWECVVTCWGRDGRKPCLKATDLSSSPDLPQQWRALCFCSRRKKKERPMFHLRGTWGLPAQLLSCSGLLPVMANWQKLSQSHSKPYQGPRAACQRQAVSKGLRTSVTSYWLCVWAAWCSGVKEKSPKLQSLMQTLGRIWVDPPPH